MLGSSKKQPRLGQWDGRRHSSRHGAPVLARLLQPCVLLRLLLVQRGQPIRREQMTLLEEEQRAFRRSQVHLNHLARGAALFLIHGLLASLVVIYVVRFQKGLAQSLSKIGGVCVLVLMTFALAI